MTAEDDYWGRLEYRVCREINGFADARVRTLWCDGFIPEEADFQGARPCIRGRAWIGDDKGSQEEWAFTLFVGQARTTDEIDWATLLPADAVTGWLTLDVRGKTLTLDPLSGYSTA